MVGILVDSQARCRATLALDGVLEKLPAAGMRLLEVACRGERCSSA
jgi:hypothetical protein